MRHVVGARRDRRNAHAGLWGSARRGQQKHRLLQVQLQPLAGTRDDKSAVWSEKKAIYQGDGALRSGIGFKLSMILMPSFRALFSCFFACPCFGVGGLGPACVVKQTRLPFLLLVRAL